jgi:integration host factor subunit beta
MTKSELITKIASQFPQLTHADTAHSIQSMLDGMVDALANNHRIEIRGFGSFSIHVREPRISRNPKTGEKVQVGAKRAPHFKAGSDLKKRVIDVDSL